MAYRIFIVDMKFITITTITFILFLEYSIRFIETTFVVGMESAWSENLIIRSCIVLIFLTRFRVDPVRSEIVCYCSDKKKSTVFNKKISFYCVIS